MCPLRSAVGKIIHKRGEISIGTHFPDEPFLHLRSNVPRVIKMTNKTKHTMYLFIAISFIILSFIIFFMADGLKRWYSGIFFLLLGIVTLLNALIKNNNNKSR